LADGRRGLFPGECIVEASCPFNNDLYFFQPTMSSRKSECDEVENGFLEYSIGLNIICITLDRQAEQATTIQLAQLSFAVEVSILRGTCVSECTATATASAIYVMVP